MYRYRALFLIPICLLLFPGANPNCVGQQKEPRPKEKKTLDDGTFKVLWSKVNAESSKMIKGAPYSAIGITEFTQTLSDGNQIIQKNEAAYYRDSEGRLRIERKLTTLGNWAAAGEAPLMIVISDPVAGLFYHLDPQTRTAQKMLIENFDASSLEKEKREKELVKMNEKLAKQPRSTPDPAPEPRKALEAKRLKIGDERDNKKTESLGTRMFEGVEGEGTRVTRTIPAGEIGNTGPIEIVDERWYSPALHITLMTRHLDPRSGETAYRLTNLSRSEPDRTLFEVPPDYTLVSKPTPQPNPKPAEVLKKRAP